MSFRLKTVLGIAMIELTVMAILIGINQFALGGSATTQLYERAEATARIFGNLVSDAVIATDLATLQATIDTAVSTEELLYLRVRSPSGFVLAEGGAAEALSTPFQADLSYEEALSDHRIDVNIPVLTQGTVFGHVEMGLSTLAVEQEIATALRWNLVVAGIGMALVAVFGSILGSVLTGQLSFLRKGARAIAAGKLDHQVPIKGRDELAETAACFNAMAVTLSEDRAVLQAQRNELLAKKARVEVIVDCMTDISRGMDTVSVPDTDRDDEIGNMARATVVFQKAMRAVESARLEQQRLIMAFDQVAEQVAVFGLDGNVLFINRAFRRFNRDILDALEDAFDLETFLREGVAQGAYPGVTDSDAWIARQLGPEGQSPTEINRAPNRILLTLQTHIEDIGVVLSAKDVTELRNSEKQLVQASKMATLGEMATGIAHELNQPLGVIRMASNNCVKRIAKGQLDPDQLSAKLERIGEQTERASQIINHMRIFGRKADGQSAPFDLRTSLSEMGALVRSQVQMLDISLKINLPEDAGIVVGEKVLFEQVLLNLMSNARDAIEARGVPGGVIELAAVFDAQAGHQITVRDTGGGVPEEVLDKLFEPFFTTKEPGKGTGLGLSISFGTIREMGGEISVTNEGEGALFKLVLPAAPAMEMAS